MSRKWKNFFYDLIAYILCAIIITCLVYMLCSCSTKYVAVPEYHYENHHTTDTIIQRDSILKENNTVIREADSTMLAELGIKIKNGERAILVLRQELERVLSEQREAVHDTIIRTDSIRVPYPVEKKLTYWQKFQIKAGTVVLFLAVAVGLYWILLWLIRKRNNR